MTLAVTALGALASRDGGSAVAVRSVTLSTVPHRVYKLPDGLDVTEKSEVWYFHVVVQEPTRTLSPRSATIRLFAGPRLVKSIELTAEACASIRDTALRKRIDESFDLRHHFREPRSLAVDRVRYELELADSAGVKITKTLDVPVRVYRQKTKLIFPLRGNFVVSNGTVAEGGHHERSQNFAYDILGLGPHFEWITGGDGSHNEDFAGWGREIVAPAAGTVVYARNDVPDNPAPGQIDMPMLLAMPEPEWSVAGNVVVIDHGNGEFSCFGHMQKGSVRVKRGDRVRQGQPIGRLGNSGHSQGPHVHYHLMDGRLLFKSDGLPSRFENVDGGVPVQGNPAEAK